MYNCLTKHNFLSLGQIGYNMRVLYELSAENCSFHHIQDKSICWLHKHQEISGYLSGYFPLNIQSTDVCCICYCQPVRCAKSLQSCPTLFDPVDSNPPGSSVHEILQARILEWAAMPSSKESSWPQDQTHVSYVTCLGR